MSDAKPPFLKRVRIENFKSIRHCDVELQPLTLLVGPNGSGKTNFLDALRFVGELMKRPWYEVVRLFDTFASGLVQYPGIYHRRPMMPDEACAGLLRHMFDHTEASFPLVIEMEFRVGVAHTAEYLLEVEPTVVIAREQCIIKDISGETTDHYIVSRGSVESASIANPPPAFEDRPYLTSVAPFPPFDSLFEAIRSVRSYAIQPQALREQNVTVENQLPSDGSGLASVLGRIAQDRLAVKNRIDDYLRAVLPGLQSTCAITLDSATGLAAETEDSTKRLMNAGGAVLLFLMAKNGQGTLSYGPRSMSDGTLQALGVLVALFQCRDLPPESAIPLVAIEEPEANLHPGAAEVLMDAMTEASSFTQVLATTHSPDFLDYSNLDPNSLLVFDASSGETVVAGVDDASRSAIRDKLYSAGELLRLEQLKPRTVEPKPR